MVYKPERNSFWTCHSCGWKHEAVCGSDVLLPKPEKCKKCGGTEFEIRTGTMVDTLRSVCRKLGF